MERGTAAMASSDKEDTKGMIMMPITAPAASALLGAMGTPIISPKLRIAGATVSTAKKP